MESQADGIECQVDRSHFKVGEVIKANHVEAPIAKMNQEKNPWWTGKGFICPADLNLIRTRYFTEVLKSASQ